MIGIKLDLHIHIIYLIEEAIIFAVRYRWEQLLEQGQVPLNLKYAVLGHVTKSPLWVAMMSANIPAQLDEPTLGVLKFNGEKLQEPNLLAIELASLKQRIQQAQTGDQRANYLNLVTKIENEIELEPLPNSEFMISNELMNQRYDLFKQTMGY